MSFSDKKEQQLKEQPKIESKIYKSPKGKYIVYQTIITETKPVEYMQAVLDNEPLE
jgi:Tol biopolymer transport system component